MTTGRNGINKAVQTLHTLDLGESEDAKAHRRDIISNLNVLNGLIELELRKQNERCWLFRDQHKTDCYNGVINDIKEAARLTAQEPGEADAKAQRLTQIEALVENLKQKIETRSFCNKIRRLLGLVCNGLLALGKIVLFGLAAGVIGVTAGAIIGSSAGPVGTIAGAAAGAVKGVVAGVTTAVTTGVATGGILSGIPAGVAAVPA